MTCEETGFLGMVDMPGLLANPWVGQKISISPPEQGRGTQVLRHLNPWRRSHALLSAWAGERGLKVLHTSALDMTKAKKHKHLLPNRGCGETGFLGVVDMPGLPTNPWVGQKGSISPPEQGRGTQVLWHLNPWMQCHTLLSAWAGERA